MSRPYTRFRLVTEAQDQLFDHLEVNGIDPEDLRQSLLRKAPRRRRWLRIRHPGFQP